MDLSGCRFIYAGVPSERYGLQFVNCDTSEYKQINGGTKSTNIYNRRSKRNYFVCDDYSDSPVSFDIEIAACSGEAFTPAELREIERWLFNRKGYYKLYIQEEDGIEGETYDIVDVQKKHYYVNCRFTNPSKLIGSGGVIGFKATLESDSHLLRQDATSVTFTLSGNQSFTVMADTDMNEYIYPKVTFTVGSSGGDISVVNNSDDSTRLTGFRGITAGIEFTMNGELNYISGNNYTKFYDRNFIRLLPGENSIAVTGDVQKIKLEWENRKYI